MSFTYLAGDNSKLLEELYQKYLQNPADVDPEMGTFFKSLDNGGIANSASTLARRASDNGLTELGVINLMNAYRSQGHLAANLDPLGIAEANRKVIDGKLAILDEKLLNSEHDSGIDGLGRTSIKNIITHMEKTYCGTIGAEHKYLVNEKERIWLETKMESTANSWPLSTWQKLRLFDKLVHADYFERFLAKKYVGKKRFSLEGGETLIPMLDNIIEEAGELKMNGIVIGMAHRGRLNVLVNTIEKPAGLIFAEFEENYDPETLDYSDVKYHLGYSNKRMTQSGHELSLSLMFNPSHLEAVNPVVLGSVRARQTKNKDYNREKYMAIIIHGDAAFSGQGVVAETLNMTNLEGFDTGGTIHVVVNNQIGFTTLPSESRSTMYATDLAKGFQIPIFHVNGDDPQAALRVVKLAMEYRQRFKKDVIIDLICYRRLGHNEMDEPAFTQPTMYEVIKKHPRTVEIFEKELLGHDDISAEDLKYVKDGATAGLENSFKRAHDKDVRMKVDTLKGDWSQYEADHSSEPKTNLLKKHIAKVANTITIAPEGFSTHPKLVRLLENRAQMYAGKVPIDWGAAEMLAFGSILQNGHNIRLCGQDSQRGTFSHRHCVMVDVKNGSQWAPLNHIAPQQGHIETINSPLSEYSVLGFEYGFSLSAPSTLVIWEAQFGDFANGAQIIFDQFLTSSEVKWFRYSGLVVLLPHGYEGQGPEHSSARLERFLQMCAGNNMSVCYPTTPAQYFHLMRRQIMRKVRKPLIVMSPKSLLRLPEAASRLEDVNKGVFKELLFEIEEPKAEEVTRLIMCSGKVHFDLLKTKKEKNIARAAICRLEQLYPYPEKQIKATIKKYPKLKEIYWVQEEPLNMGAWLFIDDRLRSNINGRKIEFKCIARPESASPAAGLSKVHQVQLKKLMSEAFKGVK